MYIVKIGGGAEINLEGVAADLHELGKPVVIVLGANAGRDALAARLGTGKRVLTSVSGYDSVFSDEAAIDLIMMSYAGIRAKRFVETCQRCGVNALALTGLDGRLVEGERNRGIRVRQAGKTLIKRDFSGKPRRINTALIESLLGQGCVPVITIPIADENGFAINSENDDIVNVLQEALHAERIVQLIGAPGLLDDADDESTLVRELSRNELDRREAALEGRMKRKLLALRRLLEIGAPEVVIADGRSAHPLDDALAGRGTRISQ